MQHLSWPDAITICVVVIAGASVLIAMLLKE
jgi:hypothetical protein